MTWFDGYDYYWRDEQAEHMAALGAMRFRLRIDDKPVHDGIIEGCDSRFDRVTAGAVVGSDGGACFVLAMSSGWDCFGCARAEGVR